MDITSYNLKNFIINGFEDEYIFSTIKNTNEFYEIETLQEWNQYFSTVKVILDIGANIGNHSIYWSQYDKIKKIIAFEPVKQNFKLLKKNILDNDISKVEIYQLGLGDTECFATISDQDSANLGATSLSFVESVSDIKIVSADSFLSNKDYCIDLVKIDVEGSEIRVLKGMNRTINKYKPIIWVEVTLETLEEVLDILNDHGYAIVDIIKFNILAMHKTEIGTLKPISQEKLILHMLQNLSASWMYRNQFLDINKQKKDEERKCKELIEQNKKLKSQFLYEQKRLEQEITIHDQQVNSLKMEVNAYKSRKIVRFAEKLWKFYHMPKFLFKKGIYITINALYQELKPYPKITDFIHKTNNKFNLIDKEAALKYPVHYGKINRLDNNKTKKIEDIKIAIICDEFTYNCFKYEFNTIIVEPSNWLRVFEIEKPDLFFCESAWSGVDSELRPWKGKIYSSTNFKNENRTTLLSILEYCEKHGIPTIFWNKEDPTHYEDKICNFVDTALKFDHIFTTAEECVQRYKEEHGHDSVHCLPFAGQPKLFNPIEKYNRTDDVVFAGSWYNQHPQRCIEMEEIFDNILDNGYNLKIYNRHYGTKDPNHFFPKKYEHLINPSVSFDQVEKVYKESKYSLNINTETKSKTMFARRVFELMLCNTLVLSNYSVGMENLLEDNVIFVDKGKLNLLDSEEKRINGLYDVLKYHTYSQRFKQILDAINYDYLPIDNGITLYYVVDNQSEIEDILKHYESINYKNKKLTLLLSKNISNHLVKNIYQQYANNEVSVYSLYYLINQNGIISNNNPYFVFADLQLKPDLIEKGILHYSYIEKQYGIALGNGFIFKKVKNIKNVILPNEKFINIFNSIFKDISIEIPVYTIQTSILKKHEISMNYESTEEFTDQAKV